jgi:hypothetical protein
MVLATNAVEDLPIGVPAFRYTQPAATNTPYILHVHGWNMQAWEKDRLGEAMYKRLYWQGYQGRFGIFRWPTYGNFPAGEFSAEAFDPDNYNKSEWQAWKSGASLRGLLANLNSSYPGQVRLTAHSMGNIVAGEALRPIPTNAPLVHTYVAMQAAVPAHAYDATTTTRIIPNILDHQTPNRYAQYWQSNSPPYFNGVGGAAKYVNFFNPQDYALAPTRWQLNQNLKPSATLNYSYVQLDDKFYHDSTLLLLPVDAFEMFSLAIESRCFALGGQPDVGGSFDTSNQVNLFNAPYLFADAHKGHSAQFRSTNMKRAIFWRTLLQQSDLD